MLGRTGVGVLARDADCMFVMMISMLMVHVTVVQIVGVPFVLDRGMAAIGTMGMVTVVAVVVSFVIVAHGSFLLSIELKIHEANGYQLGNEQIFHSCLRLGCLSGINGGNPVQYGDGRAWANR